MRIPDLDWPADLFLDEALPHEALPDERQGVGGGETGPSLWVMMRRVWVRLAVGIDRPSLAM